MMKLKEFYNKYLNKYVKKYKYYILLLILLIVIIVIPGRNDYYYEFSNKSNIKKICQLVTVKALYHNVGSFHEEAKGIPGHLVNYGYKRYWIEYDATLDIGIDCDKVEIKKKLFSNKVEIKLPKATILNDPVLDDETMIEEYETGWFTNISVENEKNYAYNKALENMKEYAKSNMELLDFAYERAKIIYENYVISIGNDRDDKLIVKFIEN